MQRPGAVTAFGILNIVFGAAGVICTPFSMLGLFIQRHTNNPVIDIINTSPVYRIWMIGTTLLGVVVAALLIGAGCGLLQLKPWGRTLSIGYSIYAIVMGLINWIFSIVFLLRPLMAQAQGSSGPQAAAAMGGAIGTVIGGCFGLIYPILLLIFMTRPKIRAAFEPPPLPGPTA